MSKPVNQINHAEVIREALDTGGHAHRCGVEWSYACSCGAEPKIEAGYASLAAMQKELEEARLQGMADRGFQGENARLRQDLLKSHATITAQAERIARLEEALGEAKANYRFMVEKAADQSLDGYRELAQRVADAENDRDEFRREVSETYTALGTTFYMDPPDGGDPGLAVMVGRLKAHKDELQATITAQAEHTAKVEDALRGLCGSVLRRDASEQIGLFLWGMARDYAALAPPTP